MHIHIHILCFTERVAYLRVAYLRVAIAHASRKQFSETSRKPRASIAQGDSLKPRAIPKYDTTSDKLGPRKNEKQAFD